MSDKNNRQNSGSNQGNNGKAGGDGKSRPAMDRAILKREQGGIFDVVNARPAPANPHKDAEPPKDNRR